ncbi:MAG: FG-GAP-like repeat-containing protein [Cytophagales bacterium]|nr:FG-GAP-like repeat-containing protein [Cytophagales bacterium]
MKKILPILSLLFFCAQWAMAQLPTVSSVLPPSGAVGTPIIIEGTNFNSPVATDVIIGPITLSSGLFTVQSATEITTNVPVGLTPGSYPVFVVNGVGTSTDNVFFEVTPPPLPPNITGISPSSAHGGDLVRISGSDFNTITTVFFDSFSASILTSGLNTVDVLVPAGLSVGSVSVTVSNSNGTSTPFPFIVLPPLVTITSIVPGTFPTGTPININGNGFSSTPTDNIVYIGGLRGTVTFASPTGLQVTPSNSAGYGSISVTVNNKTAAAPSFYTPFFTGYSPITPASYKLQNEIPLISPTQKPKLEDIDHDGKLDVAFVNSTDLKLLIYANNTTSAGGNVDFLSLNSSIYNPENRIYTTYHFIDFDNDGAKDLFYNLEGTPSYMGFRKNLSTPGNPQFGAEITLPGMGITAKFDFNDYNQDGETDIAILPNDSGGDIFILTNTGSGWPRSFLPAATISGFLADEVYSADIDNDGILELVLLTGSSSVTVISDIFTLPASHVLYTGALTSPSALKIIDYNSDGKNDIIINNDSNIGILINVSSGVGNYDFFIENIPAPYTSIDAASYTLNDFDGDARPDILFTDQGLSENYVYFGKNISNSFITTPGTFMLPPLDLNMTLPGAHILSGDLNGDGVFEMISFKEDFSNTLFSMRVYTNSGIIYFPPTITNITPEVASVGQIINIDGTNFSNNPAELSLKIGNVNVPINTSSTTFFTATIPPGCTGGQVELTHKTAKKMTTWIQDFNITLPGLNTIFGTSFITYTPVGASFSSHNRTNLKDLNADNKPDLLNFLFEGNGLSAYRNMFSATPGTPVFDASTSSQFTNLFNYSNVILGDFDFDGKDDLIIDPTNQPNILFYRNVSLVGGILAFEDAGAAPKPGGASATLSGMALRDLNNNGEKELLIHNTGTGLFHIYSINFSVTTLLSSVYTFTGPPNIVSDIEIFNVDLYANEEIVFATPTNITYIQNASNPSNYNIFLPNTIAEPNMLKFKTGNLTNGNFKDLIFSKNADNNMYVRINTSFPEIPSFFNPTLTLSGFGAPITDFTIADYDGDGLQDIFVKPGTSSNYVVVHNTTPSSASGTVFTYQLITLTGGLVPDNEVIMSGDVTGDGKADVIATSATQIKILTNTNIPKSSQTITGFVLPSTILSDAAPLLIPASATSGLLLSYTTTNASIAEIDFQGFLVVYTPGVVTITATQIGNLSFDPAEPVVQVVTVVAPIVGTVPQVIPNYTKLKAGEILNINGNGFSTTPTENIVYFGDASAIPLLSDAVTIIVTVPSGAMHSQISVHNTSTSLTGYSDEIFYPIPLNRISISGNNFTTTTLADIGNFPTKFLASDFDGNGNLDILINNQVYRNISTLSDDLLFSVKGYGFSNTVLGIIPIDYSEDGVKDVIMLIWDGFNTTPYRLLNDGQPSINLRNDFSFPGINMKVTSYDVADLDHDGRPEVVMTGENRNDIHIYTTKGTFPLNYVSSVGGVNPSKIKLMDLNDDGYSDMLFVSGTDQVDIRRNESTTSQFIFTTGGISISTPNPILDIEAAQFTTGLFKNDIVIATQNSFIIFHGNDFFNFITGTIESFNTSISSGAKLNFADINGDTYQDIIITPETPGQTAEIFINNYTPQGTLTSTSFSESYTLAGIDNFVGESIVTDFNGDGKAEILYVKSIDGINYLVSVRNNNPEIIPSISLINSSASGGNVVRYNTGTSIPITFAGINGNNTQFTISPQSSNIEIATFDEDYLYSIFPVMGFYTDDVLPYNTVYVRIAKGARMGPLNETITFSVTGGNMVTFTLTGNVQQAVNYKETFDFSATSVPRSGVEEVTYPYLTSPTFYSQAVYMLQSHPTLTAPAYDFNSFDSYNNFKIDINAPDPPSYVTQDAFVPNHTFTGMGGKMVDGRWGTFFSFDKNFLDESSLNPVNISASPNIAFTLQNLSSLTGYYNIDLYGPGKSYPTNSLTRFDVSVPGFSTLKVQRNIQPGPNLSSVIGFWLRSYNDYTGSTTIDNVQLGYEVPTAFDMTYHEEVVPSFLLLTLAGTVTPAAADQDFEVSYVGSSAVIATIFPDPNNTSQYIMYAYRTTTGIGSITITGSPLNSSLTRSYVFTVDGYPSVSGISLSAPSNQLNVGLSMYIIPTLTPINAYPYLNWTVSDVTKASIDEFGYLTGLSVGVVTVTASSVENETITGTIVINIIPEDATISVTGFNIINTTSDTLNIGDVTLLYYEIIPPIAVDTTIFWSVENSSVADIDGTSGYLTAIAEGSTWVYVKSLTYPDAVDSLLIVVINPNIVSQMSINILNPTDTVNAPREYQFYAEISPAEFSNRKVEWWVSDTTIAQIDTNGVLKTIQSGEITLRANVQFYADIFDEINVTVVDTFVTVENIYVSGTDSSNLITALSDEIPILVLIEPFNASDQRYTLDLLQNKDLTTLEKYTTAYYDSLTFATDTAEYFTIKLKTGAAGLDVITITATSLSNTTVTAIATFTAGGDNLIEAYEDETIRIKTRPVLTSGQPGGGTSGNNENPCNATLELFLDGVTVIQYQWYKLEQTGSKIDTFRIIGANEKAYRPVNSGNYFVMITDSDFQSWYFDPVIVTVGGSNLSPLISISGILAGTSSTDTLLFVNTFAGYQWFVNNRLIRNAIQGKLRVWYNGDYNVVVTNEAGCKLSSNKVKVKSSEYKDILRSGLMITDSTIENYGKPISLGLAKIYPNPVKDIITFEYSSQTLLPFSIKIYNNIGIEVHSTYHIPQEDHATTLLYFDVSGYAKGIYYIQMIENGKVQSQKIIIE